MTLNNEYNRVVDKHTALFSMIKKKTETITADKDEEVVETLEKINTISDLNQRIIEILNYPDTSMNDLTTMIKRYKENDAWRSSIVINDDEWKHIQDIMIASGELEEYVSYESLIYDEYFDEFR